MDLIWPDQRLASQLPASVRLCFTTRLSGCSGVPFQSGNLARHVGDEAAAVTRNRASLMQQLPGVQAIQWLNQVHGVDCAVATGGSTTITADAAYSRTSGLACAVLTADCLPVLLMNRDGDQVAAAHAGWRGLANGVLLSTIERFSASSSLLAVLGPAIGPAAFEVGEEVKEAFAWAPEACFIELGSGKYLADLYGLARFQLQQVGVQCLDIASLSAPPTSPYCTVTDSRRFYSYRREGQTGRQASLIWPI